MAKLENQMQRMQDKEDKMHDTLKEVSIRVARSEMVGKSIASMTKAAQASRANQVSLALRATSQQAAASRTGTTVVPPPPAVVQDETMEVSETQTLSNLMISSSEEEEDEEEEGGEDSARRIAL